MAPIPAGVIRIWADFGIGVCLTIPTERTACHFVQADGVKKILDQNATDARTAGFLSGISQSKIFDRELGSI
jgi:hypothetical protein